MNDDDSEKISVLTERINHLIERLDRFEVLSETRLRNSSRLMCSIPSRVSRALSKRICRKVADGGCCFMVCVE